MRIIGSAIVVLSGAICFAAGSLASRSPDTPLGIGSLIMLAGGVLFLKAYFSEQDK